MRAAFELAKPRIAAMVAATAAIGWSLAGGPADARLAWTLLGTVLSAAAAGTLNQWLERDADALMDRTRGRPLPSGRLRPGTALALGLAEAAAGVGLLAALVGPLPAAWSLFTLAAYLGAYTPLKRLTPHSVWLGAVAGAAPPLIGWSAAAGRLDPPALALFAIQFLWQIPHFLALFWLYREDYARAGFRVMPVVDRSGGAVAAQIALHSFALLPASLLPALQGSAGAAYGAGAVALGAAFLGVGMRASWTLAAADTRRLFLASLVYLPAIFGMLVLGGN